MDEKQVTLTLLAAEAIDITNVLGNLPTNSNAFPLFNKVKGQVEAQLNLNQPEASATPEVPPTH